MHRSPPIQFALLLASCLLIPACVTRPVRLATPCAVAGESLERAWQALQNALQTPGGCDAENGMVCEVLRARIQRLSLDCPGHPQLLMANALLAFDSRNFARAQQLLDELFALHTSTPEAAMLRARIALEQGNAAFALRFLDQQIRQTGDHPGLREVYASALYLVGRWEEAREQLTVAQRLGAPGWRVAYSLGLIAEATSAFEQARVRYQEAIAARPDGPCRSRACARSSPPVKSPR